MYVEILNSTKEDEIEVLKLFFEHSRRDIGKFHLFLKKMFHIQNYFNEMIEINGTIY